ncbi:hypothetical protein, partial [Chitinimonas prasina]|uniref:hypothetical protein n=1 Tax=Chitinimonas prasina TaxID=1434937 RepID=UPI0034D6490C
CRVSNVSASAWWPATLLVRLLRSRSAAPSSTPSTPLACPIPSPAPDQNIKDRTASSR